MKKLIKLNIIIWIIVYIIPTIAKFETIEFFTDTIEFTIEHIIEEPKISSRSSKEPRQVQHISETGLNMLKEKERL